MGDTGILSLLQDNNKRFDLENGVIVTNARFFEMIKEHFPGVRTIASCIQALNSENSEYGPRFEEYDLVTILNQHSCREYLAKYRGSADRMIVQLKSGCGRGDLYECYLHYCELEKNMSTSSVIGAQVLEREGFHVIPSQFGDLGCYSPEAVLLRRERDLLDLLEMGVRKFKVQRNFLLSKEDIDILADAVNRI